MRVLQDTLSFIFLPAKRVTEWDTVLSVEVLIHGESFAGYLVLYFFARKAGGRARKAGGWFLHFTIDRIFTKTSKKVRFFESKIRFSESFRLKTPQKACFEPILFCIIISKGRICLPKKQLTGFKKPSPKLSLQ